MSPAALPASDVHGAGQGWLSSWWVRALLVVLPCLLYAESLSFGLLELDDHLYYLHNRALHDGGWRGLIELWSTSAMSDYAPVSQLTLWLDLAVAGHEHWWFARLHGLAWFALGTLGVHALVLRLTADRGLAVAVAALYALHPVCGQSVLWLAERKNLVSFALAMWCVERYLAAVRDGQGAKAWIAALACGLAAILAKPHAVALPAMLVAYEVALGQGAWRPRLARLGIATAIAIAFVIVSVGLIRSDLQRQHLGGGLGAAILADGPILVRYLQHTLMPSRLTVYYAVPETLAPGPALAAWAVVAAVVGLSLIPRGSRRLVGFAWLFAAAALSPALNLAPQLAPMTDHYQQWALPGLLLVVCALVEEALRRIPAGSGARVARLALAGAALYAAVLSLARVPEFASKARFASAAVQKEPESGINWSLYAFTLATSPEPAERKRAGAAALRALACADAERIFPEERIIAIIEAVVSLREQGRNDEAAAVLARETGSLAKAGDSRHSAEAITAQVEMRTGHPDRAVAALTAVFTPLLQQAATELRAHCRTGAVLPDAVPPLVAAASGSRDTMTALTDELAEQRLLWSLSTAYLASGDAERAFDVAAVMVNRRPADLSGRKALSAAYRRLGLPDAAERVMAGAARP
jgi:hypothetical protein